MRLNMAGDNLEVTVDEEETELEEELGRLSLAISDASLGQIIRRELYPNLVACKNADVVLRILPEMCAVTM